MGDNVIDLNGRVRQRPGPQRQTRLRMFQAAEAEHEANDPTVRAAASATTAELLHLQLVEVACETERLKFDRLHATDARERQRLCSRRIKALRSVATAALELHRLDAGASSPSVTRRALERLLTDVLGAATEVLDTSTADRFAAAVRRGTSRSALELIRSHGRVDKHYAALDFFPQASNDVGVS